MSSYKVISSTQHISKQASKQANKETNKLTNKQKNEETNEEKNKHNYENKLKLDGAEHTRQNETKKFY